MAWAYSQGKAGVNFRDTTQKAADVGTITHQMVEDSLHGRTFDPAPYRTELIAKAEPAFAAYQKWARGFQLEIVATEIQLVSELYRCGGTPDAVGYTLGELSLLDWKTSANVYDEYVIQISTYWRFWNETHPDQPLVPGAHLLRFGKDGGFAHHWFTGEKLADAFEIFKHLREIHDLHFKLNGRAA